MARGNDREALPHSLSPVKTDDCVFEDTNPQTLLPDSHA